MQDVVVIVGLIPGSLADRSAEAVEVPCVVSRMSAHPPAHASCCILSLQVGQIVSTINGVPIKSLADVCTQMNRTDDTYPTRANKFWTIKGSTDNLAVFDVSTIHEASSGVFWKDTANTCSTQQL